MNRFAGLSLALAGLLIAVSPGFSQEDVKTLKTINGNLTKTSDKVEFKLEKGKTYTISLSSKKFDTYLLLVDPNKKLVAKNDDIKLTNNPATRNLNSRIVYKAKTTGKHTLVVSSYLALVKRQPQMGPYTLTIQLGVPKEAKAQLEQEEARIKAAKAFKIKLAKVEKQLEKTLFSGHDLEAALKKAKKKSKMVMIDFTATWCGPCHKMTMDTFSQKNVQKFLKEKAVCIKVDIDKNKALAKKFNVTAIPTIVFVDAGGNEQGRVRGYRGPEQFIPAVKEALKPKTDF